MKTTVHTSTPSACHPVRVEAEALQSVIAFIESLCEDDGVAERLDDTGTSAQLNALVHALDQYADTHPDFD